MDHLFIVGAQRSGTTYLYNLLQEHPQIAMAQPVRPEPKFFLNNELYKKGITFYEGQYFTTTSEATCYLGEKSTSYIESTLAAKRIAEFYPDSRILIILRNPVFRAYSNYLFTLQNGLEDLSFEQAINAEPERIKNSKYNTSVNPFAYRKRGYYIDHIQKYLEIFNREQIYILILEEFVNNKRLLQNLYSWLGINEYYVPKSLHQIVNAIDVEKNLHAHTPVFRNLALGYQTSLVRLEELLGSKLDVWRHHWDKI